MTTSGAVALLCAQWLLGHGADPLLKDRWNHSAADQVRARCPCGKYGLGVRYDGPNHLGLWAGGTTRSRPGRWASTGCASEILRLNGRLPAHRNAHRNAEQVAEVLDDHEETGEQRRISSPPRLTAGPCMFGRVLRFARV